MRTYTCAECGARAHKPDVRGHYDAKLREFVGGGLGTWRCPIHGPVRVKRAKALESPQGPPASNPLDTPKEARNA